MSSLATSSVASSNSATTTALRMPASLTSAQNIVLNATNARSLQIIADYAGAIPFNENQPNGISGRVLYDGVTHGIGSYGFLDGRMYTGRASNGATTGPRGTIIYPDGTTFQGRVRNGRPDGEGGMGEGSVSDRVEWRTGTLEFRNGDVYNGEHLHSQPHGSGRYNYANGNFVEGTFRHGVFQHGRGRIIDETAVRTLEQRQRALVALEREIQDTLTPAATAARAARTEAEHITSRNRWFERTQAGPSSRDDDEYGRATADWRSPQYIEHGVAIEERLFRERQETLLQNAREQVHIATRAVHETRPPVYLGDLQQNLYQGQGRLHYPNRDYSEGVFQDGVFKHGRIRKTYPNGDVYEGESQEGWKHGQGILRSANGDVYEGEFRRGVCHGRGKQTFRNGDVQEGEFQGGIFLRGRGRFTYHEQSAVYEGEFLHGSPNGQGQLRYADGKIYRGEFLESQPHGRGVLHYPNGSVYEGGFNQGERDDPGGELRLSNGTVCRGVFQRDHMVQGRISYTNGMTYEGPCIDDMPNSRYGEQGILRLANGDVFVGAFDHGTAYEGARDASDRCHGQGRFIDMIRGILYEGEFQQNEFHGRGILRHLDAGQVYEGEFQHNRARGRGRLTHANGNVYEGEFDGIPHGHGRLIEVNGDEYEGRFEDGNPAPRGVIPARSFAEGIHTVNNSSRGA